MQEKMIEIAGQVIYIVRRVGEAAIALPRKAANLFQGGRMPADKPDHDATTALFAQSTRKRRRRQQAQRTKKKVAITATAGVLAVVMGVSFLGGAPISTAQESAGKAISSAIGAQEGSAPILSKVGTAPEVSTEEAAPKSGVVSNVATIASGKAGVLSSAVSGTAKTATTNADKQDKPKADGNKKEAKQIQLEDAQAPQTGLFSQVALAADLEGKDAVDIGLISKAINGTDAASAQGDQLVVAANSDVQPDAVSDGGAPSGNDTADPKAGEAGSAGPKSEAPKKVGLKEGDRNDNVKTLQERLMDLDYLDRDEPTDFYGPATAYAVQLFQRKNGMQIDGIAGSDTVDKLNGTEAKPYVVSVGDRGTDVTSLSSRLTKLGYVGSSKTAVYGAEMEKAVKDFQERNGLVADGKIGSETREALYSDKAKEKDPATDTIDDTTDDGDDSTPTKKPDATVKPTKDTSDDDRPDPTKKPVVTPAPTKKVSDDKPDPTRKPAATVKPTKDTSDDDDKIESSGKGVSAMLTFAKKHLGKRYVRGGKGPNVFDCSGFVYWCLKNSGVSLGYMTSGGWAGSSYQRVSSMSDLRAGDIVCFRGHVGIYLGGNSMIDASSSQGKIRISSGISGSSYWTRNFICGRRVF